MEINARNWVYLPNFSQALEQLKGIYVIIVSKVNDAVKFVPLNVLQRRIPLMHTPVLDIGGVFSGHQVPVHNSGFPQYVRGLHRLRFRLHHNPQERRRHEPQHVTHPVQEVSLEGPAVRRRYHNQLLPRHQIVPHSLPEAHRPDQGTILRGLALDDPEVVVLVDVDGRRLDLEGEVVPVNIVTVDVAKRRQTKQKT